MRRPASETMQNVRGGKAYKPGMMIDTIFFPQHLRCKGNVAGAAHDALNIGAPTQLVKPCQGRLDLKNAAPKKVAVYDSLLNLDVATLMVSQEERSRQLAAGHRMLCFSFLIPDRRWK